MHVDVTEYRASISTIHHYIEKAADEPTGWLNSPITMEPDQMDEILKMSLEIKQNADVLVVIGVGGSYLGAKAIRDALSPYFKTLDNGIEVIFVGFNLSGPYMKQVMEHLETRDFYLNVISKSGSTMESSI